MHYSFLPLLPLLLLIFSRSSGEWSAADSGVQSVVVDCSWDSGVWRSSRRTPLSERAPGTG